MFLVPELPELVGRGGDSSRTAASVGRSSGPVRLGPPVPPINVRALESERRFRKYDILSLRAKPDRNDQE